MDEEIYKRQEGMELTIPQSITIIGCGGVGSWVALNIAMIGIKKLYLYDMDIVEASNLNRTPYKIKQIGKKKVIALKELIFERRNDCEVISNAKEFDTPELASELYIDCSDNVIKSVPTIKVGYDGKSFTINTTKNKNVWGVNGRITYNVPSFLLTPQLVANIVCGLVVLNNNQEFVKTMDILEVYEYIRSKKEAK